MVKFELVVMADLENIISFEPKSSPIFWFKITCTKCGHVIPNHVGLCKHVVYPTKASKIPAHLVKKCQECGSTATIYMVHGSSSPATTHLIAGEEAKIMAFDCHGCFPLDYVFGKEWNATTRNGRKIRGLNLMTGSYTLLTEEGLQVTIRNLSSTFKFIES